MRSLRILANAVCYFKHISRKGLAKRLNDMLPGALASNSRTLVSAFEAPVIFIGVSAVGGTKTS